ncbi:Hypothetical protein CINCED_3A023572 [Cinara cedri]|uniref:legumain n=1 Tax=Cinara cedri TaxID=506608 RepID=A0A5E4MZW6_9HEMI|nr:Hypothetical protein CINCED_3A023572 [Cinara cedri]
MRILYLISMVALSIGCFAGSVQKNDSNPKTKRKIGNSVYEGKQWVVLVTGSSGWENYRHQADICHAYQIVKANGIPEENIITMMVDDIAYNKKNPIKGKIYNKPYGHNVYKGVKIDYRANDVNSTNFLNIITGNKEAMQSVGSGKVVEGGPHDTIFVNFVTHGSTGFLSFPDSFLFADELNNAFNNMYTNGNFAKMLLYIEASYGGSLFDGILNERTNIMAVTASGPRENSYACYYVGFPYYTFLGDDFSVTWMENSDSMYGDFSAADITVFEDYSVVREAIDDSNVMIYGDYHIGNEPLSSFIGYQENDSQSTKAISKKTVMSGMSSKDVDEYSVLDQLTNDKLTAIKKSELETELSKNNRMRSIINNIFRDIYSKVLTATPEIKEIVGEYDAPHNQQLTLKMFPCYRSIINTISDSCFSLTQNPYTLDRLNVFANLCVADNQIHELVNNLVNESCANIPKNIINVF